MVPTSQSAITELLAAVVQGQPGAESRLWSRIYDELYAMARRQMAREPGGRTLQPTALVHETYLRLAANEPVHWANRRHLFGAAARAMRRIQVDAARRRMRAKRGGDQQRVPLDHVELTFDQDPAELLALDEALSRLEKHDPRQAQVVLLRYFAGLSIEETADTLGVSATTVEGDWRYARAWLYRELSKGNSSIAQKGLTDDQ